MKTTPAPKGKKSPRTATPAQPETSVAKVAASRLANNPVPLAGQLEQLNDTGHCIAAFATFLRDAKPNEIELLCHLLMEWTNQHGQRHIGDLMAQASELENRKLNQHALHFMTACRAIYSKDRGTLTPAEKFLTNLLLTYGLRPVTPDAVKRILAEFEEDFEICVSEVRAFAEKYPELVAANAQTSPTEKSAA